MKRRRIKLICNSCGTILKWAEDKVITGHIYVEPCPNCVGQLDEKQMMKYEKENQKIKEESSEDTPYQC